MLGRTRFLISLVIGIIAFIAVNMVARDAFYGARLDLTQEKLYTLSKETKAIIGSLKEPLHIRFFYSAEQANGLPVFQSYAAQVRGMLSQLGDLSHGNIKVDIINPAPFTEEEDMAVSHGVQGVPVDEAGTKFYFGMSVENSTDDRGVVPFFDPARDQFLEYDVVRLIHDVAHPEKKKVGMISTLPMNGSASMGMAPTGPWAVLEQMEATFDVKVLPKETTEIPSDLDVLVLVHPYGLSEATLYALDQYVLRGGKTLMFLDSHLQFPMNDTKESDLKPLMEKWGVSLVPGKVAAEKDAAIHVQQEGADTRLMAFPNVTWLEMGQGYLSKDSPVTASLNKIRVIESGYFTRDDKAAVTMEPLLQTTPAAMAVDAASLKDGGDMLAMYRNFVPDSKPLVLSAQLTGNVESAFDGTDIAKANKQHLSRSTTPMHVIALGDADMLRDEIWVQKQNVFGNALSVPTADNGAFVLNAVEYLAGDNALFGLRTRGTQSREFTALDAMKRQAELTFREREQQLKAKLQAMEGRMRELQSEQQDGKQLFTDAQQQEIKGFRAAFLETRKELRSVQHQLNRDIERLGSRLALANIALVPLLVLILAFLLPPVLRRGFRPKKRVA
jgi:ABC-type uncharacterized transport system involved in gliding motility auxiliary subunit